jgi:magnesium transporter
LNPIQTQQLAQGVMAFVRPDFTTLRDSLTVGQAVEAIRSARSGDSIQYYYVIDEEERLLGALPLRALITSPLEKPLREIMMKRVVAVSGTATVMEALEMLVMHRLMALPVVDPHRCVIGVIDVSRFTNDVVELAGEMQGRSDEMFESLGFKLSQVRGASPLKAFRFRFPWLLTTVGGGLLCAVFTSVFETTLEKSIALAFFLALVLGLGESVSIQTMSVTVQSLRATKLTWRWFLRAFRRECQTGLLLGFGCGVLVGSIVFLWRGDPLAAAVVAGGIQISVVVAALYGLCVPSLLHAIRLNPQIAAGPITLAFADVTTLLIYFTLASLVL